MGNGIETVAHLRENGHIVIMLCAFEGPPKIVRLHGRDEVIERSCPEFPTLLAKFPLPEGVRSIIRGKIERISDSCGYGVRLLQYASDRKQLIESVRHKGPDAIREYQRQNSAVSIDGLSGLSVEGD